MSPIYPLSDLLNIVYFHISLINDNYYSRGIIVVVDHFPKGETPSGIADEDVIGMSRVDVVRAVYMQLFLISQG